MSHGANSEITQAADLAVRKVFYLLGVDVDNAESVEDFRADLRFGRKLRKLADHGLVGMVGVAAVGLAAAIWHGIVQSMRK
jgi:hypothetical protein